MATTKKKTASKPRRSALASAAAEADPSGDKQPLFPEEGTYPKCIFLGLEELPTVPGRNPWVSAKFMTPEHGERVQLFCVSSKSLASTGPRIKSLAMAVRGETDVDTYNAWDPSGAFIDALQGIDEGECPPDDEHTYAEYAALYIGWAAVDVSITFGGETDGGDRFRNASFRVPEAE